MKNQRPCLVCVVAVSIFITGCATTGPKITRQELKAAEKELKVKALKYQIEQTLRVNHIGYKLLTHLPQEVKTGRYPYLGILMKEITPEVADLFDIENRKGVVIIGSLLNTPASDSMIQPGDILISIDDRPSRIPRDVIEAVRRLKPGQMVRLEVLTDAEKRAVDVVVGEVPFNVVFQMDESQYINAGATSGRVVVTYGMMRFIQSDDELAIVLGHELAHLIRGHIGKRLGTGLIGSAIGLAAGVGAEVVLPGAGSPVARGVSSVFNAQFSQEYEREADYFGILYVNSAGYNIEAGINVWERFAIEVPRSMVQSFLRTHPSSPERMVRVRKIVGELKNKTSENY